MSHMNKKKRAIQAKRGPTFVGFRPQYFKHRDDKEVIRREGKKEVREYLTK